ncbi:RNA polymerase sigma-70 factor [Mucilaginibacter conchicola]|nr:RNA polymerase sigma-70 factor [Mucilaginibacter conchicola]
MQRFKDSSTQTDAELLQLLAQGNAGAFELLYNRYVNYLYRMATSRLTDEAVAQDMVQEVFVSLYNSRNNLSHITELKGWLGACLRNRILNEIRNELLHQRHHEQIAYKSPSAALSYDNYDLQVLQKQYQQALKQLSERSREVFLMSREQHLSNKDIAERLQVSIKAIEKHMTGALKIMRRELIAKRFLMLAWLWAVSQLLS